MAFHLHKKNRTITIATFLVTVCLIYLGCWQLKRLKWKNELIAQIHTRFEQPALTSIEKIDIENDQFRKIILKGKFFNNKEIHLFSGGRSGNKDGYFILTPFLTEDNKIVLVNRGLVNKKFKEPSSRESEQINDTQEIIGIIRNGEKKQLLSPPNDFIKNIWLWISMSEIKEYTKLELENFYIAKLPDDNDNIIKALAPKFKIRNDHLQYAVTWFILAVTLVIIWGFKINIYRLLLPSKLIKT